MAEEVQPGTVESGAVPRETATASVAPGTLSRLLADLVRAPAAPAAVTVGPQPGAVIGRFELKRQLGVGGFGVVWEARDTELDRLVAFKLVRPGAKAQLRGEGLRREAEAAARLSHDNIVALHDVGTSEHGPYLVLELLKGQTLAERLAQRPLDPPEALRVFREVVRGVAHAHAEGVVHRDLKPGNVFLCADGRVKVLDFGLAHAFGRRRQSGGTPAYMAPEQWREAPEDERTDVFALGVMLFQLLSGGLPFAGEQDAVGSLRAPTLEVPAAPELGELVARMLEKDPVRRPRDAGEVLAAVEAARRALGGLDPDSASLSVRTRRHPRWRLAGLVALGTLTGIAVGYAVIRPPRSAGRADGRLQVAVADVLNETGEKELDVLSGLLVTSLEQSRKLAVMTQARVLDLAAQAGRPGLARVDETLGREVGREHGVAALLLPAVRKLGGTYAVEMRAIDPVRDEHLFTVSDRSTSMEGLLDLLDRLSEKARLELKEDPAAVEGARIRLADATTRSLEAYQHYQAGMEAWYRDGERAVALREVEEALRLDPSFAAAHHAIAGLYRRYGRPDLAKPHEAAARRDLARLPEKERAQLELTATWGRGDAPEALRRAEALAARFPEDKHVLFQVGNIQAMAGRSAEMEATLGRALALDPGYRAAANLLRNQLVDQPSRRRDVLALAERAVATRRSAANLVLLAEARLDAGDEAGARGAVQEGLRLDGARSVLNARNGCWVLERLGEPEGCLVPWERVAADGLNELERDAARAGLVGTLAIMGRWREALRLSRATEEVRRGRAVDLLNAYQVGWPRGGPPEAREVARRVPEARVRRLALAEVGLVDEAERLTGEVGASDDALAEALFQAHLHLGRGRPAQAAGLLRPLLEAGARAAPTEALVVRALLAEAALGAGRLEEVAALRPPDGPRWELHPLARAVELPRLALLRARALERLGRGVEARREAEVALASWRDPDPDLPLAVEARALLARLPR